LVISRAALPLVSIEPDTTGTISTPAFKVIDATVSGGAYVQFGGGATITGTKYYLDCQGDDSKDGKAPTTAWRSLGKAAGATLNPGDGLLLASNCSWTGTLNIPWNRVAVTSYGSGTKPIINSSATAGQIVNITGDNNSVENLQAIVNSTAGGTTAGFYIAASAQGNTLQASIARGAYAGVYLAEGATGNKILRNELRDNKMMNIRAGTNDDAGAFGVLIWGNDNEIAFNTFSGHVASSPDYIEDGAAIELFNASQNKIHHNTSSDDSAFIEIGKDASHTNVTGNIIAYNLFSSTRTIGQFLVTRGSGGDVNGPVYATKAYNNIAYLTGTEAEGVVCYSGCGSNILTLKNNILWGQKKSLYADAPFDESNNIYWRTGGSPIVQATINATSKKVDPRFVAPGTDFHLIAGSPAIDSGSNESVSAGFTTDLDNKEVPVGILPEIGAYEYDNDTASNGLAGIFVTFSQRIIKTFASILASIGQTLAKVTSKLLAIFRPTANAQTNGSITIAAVGDMNPSGNTSPSSPSGKNAAAIIAGLNNGTLDAFLGLGDFQYDQGTCTTLVQQWGSLWSQAIPKTYHMAGPTHDAASATDELGHRLFFNGQCAGSTAKSAAVTNKGSSIGPFEAYSFNLGAWHFAMMPTAALRYNTQSASSLATWLDNDLASAKASGKHLAVAYHDPYYTSSTSSHSRETLVKPWIDVMDKYDVRLTLSGSQHNYERSCPVLKDDTCTPDDGSGTTAFQVSTGGITLRSFTSSPSYIVKKFSDTHGWLKLTLNTDGSFSWQFNSVSGAGTDTGTRVGTGVVNPPPPPCPANAPSDQGKVTVPINVPQAGPYKIWARVMAPDSVNNSLYFQNPCASALKLGDKAITANQWTWVDYVNGVDTTKATVTLNAGQQNITFSSDEPGIKLDRVLLLSSTDACIPSGNGDNCTGAGPPPPPIAPEDINMDGKVDILDFSLLSSKFGQTGSSLGRSDINQDGKVNIIDFSLMAAKFGT
jgi:acid phosphatase type 7